MIHTDYYVESRNLETSSACSTNEPCDLELVFLLLAASVDSSVN